MTTYVYSTYNESTKNYDLTFVIINTYVAKVAVDYDTKDEELTITSITQPTEGYNAIVKSEDVDGLAAFGEEDIVMVTASWDGSSASCIVAGVLGALVCLSTAVWLRLRKLRCPHCGGSSAPPQWRAGKRYACPCCGAFFRYDDEPEDTEENRG